MATGMREKTTNVGGVIKRIWYAMTGATQGAKLLSLDDAGNLEAKLLNPVINGTITGTATTTMGESNKMPIFDENGNFTSKTQSYNGLQRRYSDYYMGAWTSAETFAILLFEKNSGTFAPQNKIKGTFQFNRGRETAGMNNINDWVELDIQTAYNTNIINKFEHNNDVKLCEVTYNSKTYYAIVRSTISAQCVVTFSGIYNNIDGTTAPVIISDYANNGVTNVVEANVSSQIAEGFFKKITSGVRSYEVNYPISAKQFRLSALNTAPASPSATGTTGEIRIDANYIYVCTATNTWKRTALTTW